MHFLHLLSLLLQLRMAGPPTTSPAGAEGLPMNQGVEMRIVETGAAGVIAIASQILIFATVLL
jgi:hypothetical protein